MLVKAMEVSGIEGNFRSTCENVMQVLRTHKDSVMAMMEVNTLSFFSIVNSVIENSSLLKHITNTNFLIYSASGRSTERRYCSSVMWF